MSEIKHLITLSDHNYIVNGMCLYDSLMKHTKTNFCLHYLCLNDYTYNKINSLDIPNIAAYPLSELDNDPDFETLKQNNTSRPIDTSDGQSTYHWALASFFSNYLMNTYNLPNLLYVDSDIIFYENVNKVFDAVYPKSIGIITHKHIPIKPGEYNVGTYNVGVIYFKNDKIGNECLKFWRDCCVNPNNEYSKTYGICGDQKYLELFAQKYGEENVEVLCRKVGNGAPWNFRMFIFTGLHDIIWEDPNGFVLKSDEQIPQSLVFNHFSHMTPNYENSSYRFDRGGEWGPQLPKHPGVEEIYTEYFIELNKTKVKYNL